MAQKVRAGRTVKVGEFQRMMAAERAAENGERAPGFRAPAMSVAEQLQSLTLEDDLADDEEETYPINSDLLCRECGGAVLVRSEAEDRALSASLIGGNVGEVICLACPGGEAVSWRQAEDRAESAVQAVEYDVATDGTVADVRPAEMTPDRGDDVGTTVHQVGEDDDGQRFSGGGASDDDDLPFGEPSKLIPADRDFGGKPYREAPELGQLAADLMERHGYLEHLTHCRLRYFWKRKTGSVDRERVTGGLKRGSDLLGYLLGAEFAIYLAADTARERQFNDRRVSRYLFRQLRRIGQDDKGNWILLPFTLRLFSEEIQEYADVDDEDLRVGRNAYRNAEQMGLFDDAADDDDDEDDEDLDDDDGPPMAGTPEDVYGGYEPVTMAHDDAPPAPDDVEPDTSGELPTGDEIDAARASDDGDILADPAVI